MSGATTKHQPVVGGGDDLDDGLELDPTMLADSDVEGGSDDEAPGGGAVLEDEEDAFDLQQDDEEVVDEDDEEERPQEEGSKKRKAGGESEAEFEKKRRKKEKEKERKARKAMLANNELPPALLPPPALSNFLLDSQHKAFPQATTVELQDMRIPEQYLLSPPSTTPVESLEELASFITTHLPPFPPFPKNIKGKGTPQLIILALSGLRCADIVRALKPIKAGGEMAKLFAKHFKLADQVKYLEKTKVSIAVGTPGRIGKLLSESDALKITKNTIVLLDISHKDSKTRSLLTIPEIRDELWKGVFAGEARKRLLVEGVKIGVF